MVEAEEADAATTTTTIKTTTVAAEVTVDIEERAEGDTCVIEETARDQVSEVTGTWSSGGMGCLGGV